MECELKILFTLFHHAFVIRKQNIFSAVFPKGELIAAHPPCYQAFAVFLYSFMPDALRMHYTQLVKYL